jgi:hypothetical protein
VLAYPYSHHWQARVDGAPVAIYRANGISQAVKVRAGKSVVEFRYWSTAAVAGAVVSLLALTLLGIWVSLASTSRGPRRRLARAVLAVLVIMAGTTVCTRYCSSLYTQGDSGSRRKWCAEPAGRALNLAYSRPTTASGALPSEAPYQFGGQRAVDGSRDPGNMCLSDCERQPYWTIDLGATDTIATIIVYLPEVRWILSSCPNVYVLGSTDARDWRLLGRATPNDSTQAIDTIVCPDSYSARFIRISSPDSCAMALNEVEVYPPAGHPPGRSETKDR